MFEHVDFYLLCTMSTTIVYICATFTHRQRRRLVRSPFHLWKMLLRIFSLRIQSLESSMDWVHCNNCYCFPGGENRFFLTSCGHMYCAECKDQCTNTLCKLCGNQCSSIPLTSQMKPDVEMYFIDPFELLKRELRKIQMIVEFQNSHRSRLSAHLKRQMARVKPMKEDFKKVLAKFKESEGEKHKWKQECAYMKQMIDFSQHCTPEQMKAHSLSGSAIKYKGDAVSPYGNNSTPVSASHSFSSRVLSRSAGQSMGPITDGRITVRTPPINGRMGVIPGSTPSPTTVLSNLCLSMRNSEMSARSPLYSSQDSTQSPSAYPVYMPDRVARVSPSASSTGSNRPVKLLSSKARKNVVHPFGLPK